MADVNRGNRPLSPHMTVYRWPITAITSILTRITGNAMIVAAIMIVWWLLAASVGPDYFATANAVLTSFIGDLILFLSMLGLWYHLLAGLRHLVWDNAVMLDVPTAVRLSWGCLIGSVVLAILTAIII